MPPRPVWGLVLAVATLAGCWAGAASRQASRVAAPPALSAAPQEPAGESRPAPPPLAVIVSWDGAKPSVMRRLVEEGRLPVTQSLMEEGVYSLRAQTVVPSSTLPSHAAMLTGLGYQRHGVDWNSYQPRRGFVRPPTVFALARQAGLSTAMVFAKEKFKHLAQPGTVDALEYVRGDAFEVAETAIRLLREQRLHLLFVHFADPDSAGHGFGWGSQKKGVPPAPQYLAALERCDEATGRIIATLKAGGRWGSALLVITADHGGHDTTHGSADPEDVHIPWIAGGGRAPRRAGRTLRRGDLATMGRVISTMDTGATALAALGIEPPEDWDGKPVGTR